MPPTKPKPPEEFEDQRQEAAATLSGILSFIGKLSPIFTAIFTLLVYVYARDLSQTREELAELKVDLRELVKTENARAVENATLKTKLEGYDSRIKANEDADAAQTARIQELERAVMRQGK